MSKYDEYSDAGPCRSTSHHHGFAAGTATDMWFGTMSTTTPMPAARAADISRTRACSPPSSGDTAVGSTTS
jgi:hypothetical protein